MSWGSPPREMHCMILNALTKHNFGFASYASVCPDWQRMVEPQTFRQLDVTFARLGKLSTMARSRSALVQHIKLLIRLPQYDCSQCEQYPSASWKEIDADITGASLRSLFVVLPNWPSRREGLTLDVVVACVSDAEHRHKNCLVDYAQKTDRWKLLSLNHGHGWRLGEQQMLPPEPATWRLSRYVTLNEEFWDGLPQVPAVTCLQLCRQTRRRWPPHSLRQLLSYLPPLRKIYYEPWQNYLLGGRDSRILYASLFEKLGSDPMDEVVISEAFDDFYHGSYPKLLSTSTERACSWPWKANIADTLAQASLRLSKLSASFAVDADKFFGSCLGTWTWDRLSSLALASQLLVRGRNEKINHLLWTVATVVKRMPSLDTMVLWNHKEAAGVDAFTYQASATEAWAKVVWRATWDLSLHLCVIQSWTDIALERTSSKPVLIKEQLPMHVLRWSLCEAITGLKPPCEVVHPHTLERMHEEVLCRERVW